MTKILKFPDRNSPASKKEFEKLLEYKNAMEKNEADALKYTKKFLKKLMSISNHLTPLTKKEKNELLREIKDDYKDLFNSKENTIPTDIQILINDKEIGMAVLRLIEIIGQDKIEDLGSETLYFLINALNQMNIDPIRNEILYSVLPLRA